MRWAGALGGGLEAESTSFSDLSASGGAGRCPGGPSPAPPRRSIHLLHKRVLMLSVNLEQDAGPGEGGQTALQVRAVCKPTPCAWVYVPASAEQPGLLLGSASLRQESRVAYFCSVSGKGAPWGPPGGPCAHVCSHTGPRTHAEMGHGA